MENAVSVTSAQTRTALLDAAEHVFAERGFEATGIRDITDRAGVAHGLVRHHFASKEGLWRAVIDRAIDRYAAAMTPHATRAAAHPARPLTATRDAARGFLDVSMRHPRVVRLILHEGIRGGSRLDYLLNRYLQVAATMGPLFQLAKNNGYLANFDQPSMFLFMLTAGAAPFALPALSAGVLGAPLEPDTDDAERHINRILDTLLGPEPNDADS
jgi:AcrR family transcriptional regulator